MDDLKGNPYERGVIDAINNNKPQPHKYDNDVRIIKLTYLEVEDYWRGYFSGAIEF